MTNQLILLDNESTQWRLDERTRRVGFEGIARAREVLRAARERDLARSNDTEAAAA